MRKCEGINHGWKFAKADIGAAAAAQMAAENTGTAVDLPHTWNAVDGQDGGNDYYRGRCWYARRLPEMKLGKGEELWLEFGGVAMMAAVYVNGHLAGTHDGGYSIFRVNLTPWLEEENIVAVSADNSAVRTVYPQKADFTFYGGIYRDVRLLRVSKEHFALGRHGGSGLKVTPRMEDGRWVVEAQVWTENVREAEAGKEAKCAPQNGTERIGKDEKSTGEPAKEPRRVRLRAELLAGERTEALDCVYILKGRIRTGPWGCLSFFLRIFLYFGGLQV